MHVRNGKIYITRTSMNRLYHGTHKVWDVLRNEGALLLEAIRPDQSMNGRTVVRAVEAGQHPLGPIVGVMVEGEAHMSSWGHKFVTTNPTALEDHRVKEVRVQGLPPILVETKEMKGLRLGRGL